MRITIRKFLTRHFVEDGHLIEPQSKIVRMYNYFVLIAMRHINGDKNPYDFIQGAQCMADDREMPYQHLEQYIRDSYPDDSLKKVSNDAYMQIAVLLKDDAGKPGISITDCKKLPQDRQEKEEARMLRLYERYLELIKSMELDPQSKVEEFLTHFKTIVMEDTEVCSLDNVKKNSLEKAIANLRAAAENDAETNTNETIVSVEADDSEDAGETFTKDEKEIIDLIKNGKCYQIIFTGAPGTGKTYIAKHIAQIGEELTWLDQKEGKYPRYEFVQFHPSYDYTDFVEGLRPVGESGVPFHRVDGIFKSFCRRVAEENNPQKTYFFIIDEINRANLSKVFGELMYCLERDKRGPKNSVQTQYRNLPTYTFSKENKKFVLVEGLFGRDIFEDGFYIPENVVIIGTMNDIDRSVDTMDFALRRRFEWWEFEVTKDTLKESFHNFIKKGVQGFQDMSQADAKELANAINRLNGVISKKGPHLGLTEPKHYYISQGQFANLPVEISDDDYRGSAGIERIKRYVWKYRLKFLLREYVRGEAMEDINEFIDKAAEQFGVPEEKEDAEN